MKVSAMLAAVCVGGAMMAAGCDETHDTMRPDPDRVVKENGLQSADLRQMCAKLAPQLLQIQEIAGSPYKATIVVEPIENHLEDAPGRDLGIYVNYMAGVLAANASDRVAFVDNQAHLQGMQAQELNRPTGVITEDESRTGVAPVNPRQQPQYALWGKFFSMNNGKTTYYVCQFQLTNLVTGVHVWGPAQYEVRTLNIGR